MTRAATVDRSPAENSALAIWGFALALATLGTAILWEAPIGINWGVWIACDVVALFAVMRERFGTVGAPSLAACAWAVTLAFGAAVTADERRIALLVLATVGLMAVALATAGQESTEVLQPGAVFMAPIAALWLVITGVSTETRSSVRGARSPAFESVVRSALITLPLVAALIFLLAEADPMFAAVRDTIEHIVPANFISKALFFGLIFAVTLGSFGGVLRAATPEISASTAIVATIGSLERRVLLTALATIMWLFVTSAGISLLKNPAAVAGSGITYAEYVHRGFAELSLSATLVIGVVLLTRRSWVSNDAWARRLAFAAITGEGGMIAVAFMRVVRYEQAYGFTVLRLYAQAYMIVLACMSALLLAEIVRRAQSSRFAFHSANAALFVLASCVFWNTDAWIVRHNVDRYAKTGKIDVEYLTHDLSADATPAMIASLPRLEPREHAAVSGWLCDANTRKRHRDPRWFAWNLRASREATARRDWYRKTQANCTPPA